ncbi:glycosyltransferase [Corynebacterium breve]|uniref:Glycosyltransferase n=1 Tax=Corynebacterium breve TaxID=3049799 RepID=A0ABY8VGC1_9CORY|nr:glycosyltransferase [Corynebacterium breve]WIM68696.1 glycosyltransferase [Corynebacterium breve]
MTQRLKVAHFVDNYGPGSNGLMFAVQQLEGDLLARGHQVVVVAPAAKGPNPHQGHPERTEIRMPSVWVPRMPTRVASGRHFKRTIKRVAKLEPNVIHVHGLGPLGVLGLWVALRLDIPLLVTWHTDFDAYARHYPRTIPFLKGVVEIFARLNRSEIFDAESRKTDRLELGENSSLLGLMRRMLTEADLVTAPSPKTVKRALMLAPDAKVLCVPNGVDPLPVSEPPIERGHGPLIMYAGRIAPEKGLTLLCDAFELVAEAIPDAQLMIVGDWTRYKKIRKRLEELRAGHNVLLPGEQPRESLGAFYGMADIFAFPSTTDTQALVLHEAALAGLPIVTADPELDLVIDPGVNGLIANDGPVAFAAALLRVINQLDDDTWRTRAAARSIELASQWSVESQAEEIIRLYQGLAAGRE